MVEISRLGASLFPNLLYTSKLPDGLDLEKKDSRCAEETALDLYLAP
jgi:hypothetical protein